MSYKIEKLPKSTIELTFTVTPEDAKPFLKAAAERLSQQSSIPGFRPGKAPYEMVKQRVGEMAILEEALEHIVRKNYTEAVMAEDLDTVGSPEINVEKLAPGNAINFKIIAALVPKIEKLADYKSAKITKEKIEITDDKVEKVLGDLAKMQTKETIAERASTKADKIVVDMEMEQGGVIVEGGKSPNFQVYLNEENYLPGLTDKLVGLKTGEEKKFQLDFPKEHFQKNLAGKKVDIKVKVNGVYQLEQPKIDNEFAKSVGQTDIAALKNTLRENIAHEAEHEQEHKLEQKIFEDLINNSRFADVPDVLVNEEVNKMIQELEQNAASQGMKMEDYLASVKKDLGQLKLDFAPEAIRRVKAALIVREINIKENIEVADAEIDKALDQQAEQYKDNEDAKKQIYSPEYREYITTVLKNRKVLELLHKNMVK
jgi:trigger factor